MSAAVHSEPSEPHSRLRATVSVPRDRLLGRAGTPPLALRRVTLRLWSLDPADRYKAEKAAANHPGSRLWSITETVPSSGGLCPIPLADPLAIQQGADYGYAWAVYPDWGTDV